MYIYFIQAWSVKNGNTERVPICFMGHGLVGTAKYYGDLFSPKMSVINNVSAFYEMTNLNCSLYYEMPIS